MRTYLCGAAIALMMIMPAYANDEPACMPQVTKLQNELEKHFAQNITNFRMSQRSAYGIRYLQDLGMRHYTATLMHQKWDGLSCDQALEVAIDYMLDDSAH